MNPLEKITRYKQSCLKIADAEIFYFDPFMLDVEAKDGDYILVTHGHGDHYSPENIRKVAKNGATLVAPKDIAAQMTADGFQHVKAVAAGDTITLGSATVEVLPAYNLDKDFHPKSNGWVGYIVRFADCSYYIPGDVDAIPEFLAAKADVFFVPIGGTYTMDVPAAIAAVNAAKPKFAVPFHFATLDGVGVPEDGPKFVEGLLPEIKGVLL